MREPTSTTYKAFLATADPLVWAECLNQAERSLDRAPEVDSVIEGLCISIYTQWLCSLSGDSSLGDRAKSVYRRFVKAMEKLNPGSASVSTDLAWGIILGWTGYTEHARPLLGRIAGECPEIALLVQPDGAPERAAMLRRLVAAPEPVFLPALYYFCSALIDLGATQEATDHLNGSGLSETDPLACELFGKVHEREAEWSLALAAYERSKPKWPSLRLRTALCRTIAKGGAGGCEFTGMDDGVALAKAMSRVEAEIDQVEITRALAFVNACLWNPTDDWMIHFELGKLNFRRRRYTEADAHLRTSLALAPEACRFPIADLRSTNLTWLTGSTHSRDLDMEPEAIEGANAALQLSTDERASAATRVWLAEAVKDPALLPAAVAELEPSLQERAYALADNAPEALRCALDAFAASRDHRILMKLVRKFNSSGLERSVDYLLDLGTRESWNSFFELWELASFVFGMRGDLSESTSGFMRVNRRVLELADRLIELSECEFQHLIRAYDLFSTMNWQDAAEEVLRRAAGLAEGTAENLCIAVARRKAEGFDPARAGRQGLDCLRKAESEARDRLEKLQIARELFYYGQAQQARRILETEAVFNPNTLLRHIEFIVVLQCRSWLKEEEHSRLAERAAKALDADIASGAITHAGDRFKTRLKSVLQGRTYLELDAGGSKPPIPLDNLEWHAWNAKLEEPKTIEDLGGLKDALQQGYGGRSTFAARFCAWTSIKGLWESALATSATRRPELDSSEIPISRNYSIDEDVRALAVSDLWRNYFSVATADARVKARDRIDRFYAEEAGLLERWERQRRQKVEPLLRGAVLCGESAIPLLRSLVSPAELRHPHPLLRQLYERAAADCEALASSVEGAVSELEATLGGAPIGGGSGV